jgi:hypothetical protein|tara:strand:+ start:993 stop:1274 length:282 start_codon:yes stop_codon:yes gene_type:complete
MSEPIVTEETENINEKLSPDREKLVLPIANNILNNVTLGAAFQVLRDQSVFAARERASTASDDEIQELLKEYFEGDSEKAPEPEEAPEPEASE